jgi:dTDP-4-dehydrorhamnose 3,5-epimerase
MIFNELPLKGAFIIEAERLEDERGFFARTFCRREFLAHGLKADLAQASISFNRKKGTLRGMHLQTAPFEEVKLVRCTMGAIHDVIIDLRIASATFGKYASVDLSSENRRMLYVPEGFAHGFITLVDNTEILYEISQFYSPAYAVGVRWNDPQFAIQWPIEVEVMSDKDRNLPDFHL